MQILLPGKNDGFVLLKSLVFIIPLVLIVGVMVFLQAQLLRYTSSICEHGKKIIEEQNQWVEQQLQR